MTLTYWIAGVLHEFTNLNSVQEDETDIGNRRAPSFLCLLEAKRLRK